ncbi:MAG: hypothetical protein GWN71_01545 [Gammaproteobacteria bacterium]|nr:hypothetical protein [Actinomycetota bacterium]NIU72299.1 hypothetical protein [Gammaproteobacteria bacterium]
MDKPGRGYMLRASSGEATAVSRPFDILSDISVPGMYLETLLCLKPNPQSDSEALTYVPETDAFWIADDDHGSIYEVERATGAYVTEIELSTILDAFPEAAQCDDGDGDPSTTCSYLDNFELLTYDRAASELYLVNSVDMSPPDRPAIFRLAKGDCAACFDPVAWQPLPFETRYLSVVARDGQILLALNDHLYEYDYDTNHLATVDMNGDSLPPAYETFSDVVDMSFDGTSMWILTVNRVLHQVEWASRTEVATFDLASFGFSLPRGLAVVQDTVYILEGDIPNPIYVLRRTEP